MIRRERGYVVFECDGGCGEEVHTEHKDFNDALEEFKVGDGKEWLTTKASGDWEHFCKDCKVEQLEL